MRTVSCHEVLKITINTMKYSRLQLILKGGEVVAEEDEVEEDGKEAAPTLARFLTTWFHAQ